MHEQLLKGLTDIQSEAYKITRVLRTSKTNLTETPPVRMVVDSDGHGGIIREMGSINDVEVYDIACQLVLLAEELHTLVSHDYLQTHPPIIKGRFRRIPGVKFKKKRS